MTAKIDPAAPPRGPARWLAAALLLLLPAVACGREHGEIAPDPRPAVAVATTVAQAESWDDGLELTAGLRPLHRATPGTVLMGRVDAVLVQEGDRVRRGQVLARVESRDVAARVAQAEANVAAARAAEQNAKLMLERMQRLHARQAASQRDLDDATAAHEAAQANLRAAEEGVKAARVALTYSEVKAPFAGFVVDKRVEVGDTTAPGVPLFVIEDVSRVKVEAQVPESVAAARAVGDPVEIEIQGRRLEGRLDELLPAADPRSRTFTVRAVLDNPDSRLRSGMFARLRLPGSPRTGVSVPASAVVRRGPLTGLFVVDDETSPPRARLRWVTLGQPRGERVEVLTGLEAGEILVAEPPAELEDGQPLEVRG